MSSLMDRKRLLAKEKLDVVQVDLGDGDHVFVRQMTGRERDRFEQSLIREVRGPRGEVDYVRAMEDFRAKLAVNTLCDTDGKNLLEPNDYEMLSQHMSAFRLETIVNAAQKINQISEEDTQALIKKSESAPEGASTSASAES